MLCCNIYKYVFNYYSHHTHIVTFCRQFSIIRILSKDKGVKFNAFSFLVEPFNSGHRD